MGKLYNRVKVSTSTTGTGTITLGSAVRDSTNGDFLTFAEAGVSDGEVVSYFIQDGANFACGEGTYTASGTTLSRDASEKRWNGSSYSTAALSLSGSAVVYISARAADIIVDWSGAKNTASPNATVPATSITPNGSETNIDAVIAPKGNGATLAQVPDGTSTAGNKRGTFAVDFQRQRSTAAAVASGNNATIGGGFNNKASGNNSSINGGGNNTASADVSTVCGGTNNTVSAGYSNIAGGDNNTVSGGYFGAVGGGYNNDATATGACVAGGYGNVASGSYASVSGGKGNTADGVAASATGVNATARGLYGADVRASGKFTANGDAQRGEYIARRSTTNATPTVLTFDGGAPGTTNQVILPNDSTYRFEADVVGRRTDADNESAAYTIVGCIDRNANAASTALVGTPAVTVVSEDTAAWDVAASADTTNGGLAITVTGEAAKTIRWVAFIRTVEVTG